MNLIHFANPAVFYLFLFCFSIFGVSFIVSFLCREKQSLIKRISFAIALCSAISCFPLIVFSTDITGRGQIKAEPCWTITDLIPGFYELNNVWLVEDTTIAVLRPIRIDVENPTNHVGSIIQVSDDWILCDVTGDGLFAKKYRTATNPFTGIVQVKETKGTKTISTYRPFVKK